MNNNSKGFHWDRIGMHVTHRCNLNCKLCASGIPYYKDKWHPSLEYLQESVRRILDVLDSCSIFTISGGEPLLRSDLPEFLESLLKYKDKINIGIDIITNGSILPNENFFHVLSSYKGFRVLLDDYGRDYSKQANAILKALQKYGINYRYQDYHSDDQIYGGWTDFGDYTLKNTYVEAKEICAKCSYKAKLNFSLSYAKGVVYPCMRIRATIDAHGEGYAPLESESLDLFDDSLSIEDKRGRIKGFADLEVLSACLYCNGLREDSVRYPAGIQFTKEELLSLNKWEYA